MLVWNQTHSRRKCHNESNNDSVNTNSYFYTTDVTTASFSSSFTLFLFGFRRSYTVRFNYVVNLVHRTPHVVRFIIIFFHSLTCDRYFCHLVFYLVLKFFYFFYNTINSNLRFWYDYRFFFMKMYFYHYLRNFRITLFFVYLKSFFPIDSHISVKNLDYLVPQTMRINNYLSGMARTLYLIHCEKSVLVLSKLNEKCAASTTVSCGSWRQTTTIKLTNKIDHYTLWPLLSPAATTTHGLCRH